MMRAGIQEEFKRGPEKRRGSGTVLYLYAKVQSTGNDVNYETFGKDVKLSTDVQLPPKLPPSESDRKDQGSIKIGGNLLQHWRTGMSAINMPPTLRNFC